MKERPILFSAPMVRAILSGQKTQTRRVVKPQPNNLPGKHHPIEPYRTPAGDWNWVLAATGHGTGDAFCCPHGKPGDRLWVREQFKAIASGEVKNGYGEIRYGYAYYADGQTRWNERTTIIHDMTNQPATGPMQFREVPWKPSIHMPYKASRILLEIVSVRVERLQEINEDDAESEGIEGIDHPTGGDDYQDYWRNYLDDGKDGWPWFEGDRIASFRSLWESINGAGSWDANPWVWVIEFKRINGAQRQEGGI